MAKGMNVDHLITLYMTYILEWRLKWVYEAYVLSVECVYFLIL